MGNQQWDMKDDHQEDKVKDHQEDKEDNYRDDVEKLPVLKKRQEGNQAAKELMRVHSLRMATKDINKCNPIKVDEPRPH